MSDSISQLVIFLLGLLAVAVLIVAFGDIRAQRARGSRRDKASLRRQSAANVAPPSRRNTPSTSSKATGDRRQSPQPDSERAPDATQPMQPILYDLLTPAKPSDNNTAQVEASQSYEPEESPAASPEVRMAPVQVRDASVELLADLAEQMRNLAERLQVARHTVGTLPTTLNDYYTLNAECLAAEGTLAEAQTAYEARIAETCVQAMAEVRHMQLRIERVIETATTITDELARFDQMRREIVPAAQTLVAFLDALEQYDEYPIRVTRHSSDIRSAVMPIDSITGHPPPASHDELRRRLHELRARMNDITAWSADLAHIGEQQRQLSQLLHRPELAAEPEWWRSVTILCRSRGISNRSAAAALATDASQLLERLRTIHVQATPTPPDMLDESRLDSLLDEAMAVEMAVRDIWQRARALAQARSSEG